MRKRDYLILAAAIAAAVFLALGVLWDGAVETGSWGLHFQTSGEVPQGPDSAQTLAAYGAAYVGDPEEKVLYLTFDAGYENGCMAEILDTLKAQNVPAAFFLVGNYLERNADLVRRMVAEGHIVGNHTMNHPDMRQLSDREAFARELTQLEDLFREVTGKELPKFYRPPQGMYSRENLQMAQDLGYRTVFWSLAYADWNNDDQPTDQEAFDKLLPRTHNGAVILLHATSRTNGRILDSLLTRWKEMGYTFAPLTELFS